MNYKTLFSQTKDLSLLLVEDYEPLRNDMKEILADFFKTVIVASDGSEALKLYKEYNQNNGKDFDIVITDIQMPIMNGVELSESIRNINEKQQIIVLSAYTEKDYLLKLINIGIAQFITKPINHEELINTLIQVSNKINSIDAELKNNFLIDLGENYIWNQEKLLLKKDDIIVEMTQHELLLMHLLVEKDEHICTNDDVIKNFYSNGVEIGEKSIRNLIFKVRKKIPKDVISSIYGMGYKFTSPF